LIITGIDPKTAPLGPKCAQKSVYHQFDPKSGANAFFVLKLANVVGFLHSLGGELPDGSAALLLQKPMKAAVRHASQPAEICR